MIIGIGIDTIDIQRFKNWHTFSPAQLRRIFSDAEIAYCLSVPAKSAERFAVRFAAREAFFKALSSAAPEARLSLLWVSKLIRVSKGQHGAPCLVIDWLSIREKVPELNKTIRSHISLSHTAQTATALVILEAT